MQLYIANKNDSFWSLRPWVLMHTLGIAFDETLKPYPMGGGATGFDRFSPSARVPVLLDEGTTVWDSLAITEYVAEQHAQVWPSDNMARAWARCQPIAWLMRTPCVTCLPCQIGTTALYWNLG